MQKSTCTFESNHRTAKQIWGSLSFLAREGLRELTERYKLSVMAGDLLLMSEHWYVTHTGLIQLAVRKRCVGIRVSPATEFCDAAAGRWAFRATVYKTKTCRGFVGYGGADPSNISFLVHGAEMHVAETRAVNRALRKAYRIGICSVEEIGSFAGQSGSAMNQPLLCRAFPWAFSLALAHLARTALRASSRLSSAVSFAVRALPPFRPPRRPRATAWGFFFFGMSLTTGYARPAGNLQIGKRSMSSLVIKKSFDIRERSSIIELEYTRAV
jgi:hypothetical protein